MSTSPPERIAEYFGADIDVDTLGENYNVAPTHDIYAVTATADGERHVEAFQWGLLPTWAKDRKIGQKMINARSETLAEKPAFKGIFKKHRCIIPMDGFYEWAPGVAGGPVTKAGKLAKRPHFIYREDGEPLAVAGLWSAWRDPEPDPDSDDGQWLHTATVVTTSANSTMRPVHDRMPVILPRSVWSTWLDPSNQDLTELGSLLVPAPDDLLTMHQVGTEVGNVRNRGAELTAPLTMEATP